MMPQKKTAGYSRKPNAGSNERSFKPGASNSPTPTPNPNPNYKPPAFKKSK